jgi:hypothetical protein
MGGASPPFKFASSTSFWSLWYLLGFDVRKNKALANVAPVVSLEGLILKQHCEETNYIPSSNNS